MWYIWLIAAGIFFIVEIITVGFLVFWLGVSALLAMVVSLFTDNLFIQTLVFVISCCVFVFVAVQPNINNEQAKIKQTIAIIVIFLFLFTFSIITSI